MEETLLEINVSGTSSGEFSIFLVEGEAPYIYYSGDVEKIKRRLSTLKRLLNEALEG